MKEVERSIMNKHNVGKNEQCVMITDNSNNIDKQRHILKLMNRLVLSCEFNYTDIYMYTDPGTPFGNLPPPTHRIGTIADIG